MANNTLNVIRKQRETLGLSLTRLSRLSGVPVTTISDMETGRHTPTFNNLTKVVDALADQTGNNCSRSFGFNI